MSVRADKVVAIAIEGSDSTTCVLCVRASSLKFKTEFSGYQIETNNRVLSRDSGNK